MTQNEANFIRDWMKENDIKDNYIKSPLESVFIFAEYEFYEVLLKFKSFIEKAKGETK